MSNSNTYFGPRDDIPSPAERRWLHIYEWGDRSMYLIPTRRVLVGHTIASMVATARPQIPGSSSTDHVVANGNISEIHI